MDEPKNGREILGQLTLTAILVVYSCSVSGFVLLNMWCWFVLPVFPQLPHINFQQAIGLMFFIDLFKNRIVLPEYEGLKKKKDNYMWLLFNWIALGIAWIFHVCMNLN